MRQFKLGLCGDGYTAVNLKAYTKASLYTQGVCLTICMYMLSDGEHLILGVCVYEIRTEMFGEMFLVWKGSDALPPRRWWSLHENSEPIHRSTPLHTLSSFKRPKSLSLSNSTSKGVIWRDSLEAIKTALLLLRRALVATHFAEAVGNPRGFHSRWVDILTKL